MNRRTALLLLVVADVALFLISGIPAVKDPDGDVMTIVSNVVWLGFLLGLLALLVLGAVAGVRRVRRAGPSTESRK
jgi:hypothetical protein